MGKGVRATVTNDPLLYRVTGRYSSGYLAYLDQSATCISYPVISDLCFFVFHWKFGGHVEVPCSVAGALASSPVARTAYLHSSGRALISHP